MSTGRSLIVMTGRVRVLLLLFEASLGGELLFRLGFRVCGPVSPAGLVVYFGLVLFWACFVYRLCLLRVYVG